MRITLLVRNSRLPIHSNCIEHFLLNLKRAERIQAENLMLLGLLPGSYKYVPLVITEESLKLGREIEMDDSAKQEENQY